MLSLLSSHLSVFHGLYHVPNIFTLKIKKCTIEEESCVVASILHKETHMKYYVTYRLLHPKYMPTTLIAAMEAHSHAELDAKLSKIKTKWQAREYIVQITHVTKQKGAKLKRHL
jgi:hypothetical protein